MDLISNHEAQIITEDNTQILCSKTEAEVSSSKQEAEVRAESPTVDDAGGELEGDTSELSISQREEIVIRRTKTVTVKVPVEINKCKVKAVVDTGASVTILNAKLYFSIPPADRPSFRKFETGLRVAEENARMTTLGIADMDITIGNNSFTWPVYIAPIGDEMLLGCDVIDEWDITVNTRSKGAIEMNGQWIQCEIDRLTERTCRGTVSNSVRTLRDTVSNSVMMCRTAVSNSVAKSPFWGKFIEGRQDYEECLDTRYSVLEPVYEDQRHRKWKTRLKEERRSLEPAYEDQRHRKWKTRLKEERRSLEPVYEDQRDRNWKTRYIEERRSLEPVYEDQRDRNWKTRLKEERRSLEQREHRKEN